MGRIRSRRGSAVAEFALTGTMFILMWVFIVQLAIALWQYHNLQYAVKVAGSYTSMHGSDCSSGTNSCSVTIGTISTLLKNNLAGLDPTSVQVTFNAIETDHSTVGSTVSCQLSGGSSPCLSNATTWPPSTYNTTGNDTEILAEYQVSVMGKKVWLPGFTHQTIIF